MKLRKKLSRPVVLNLFLIHFFVFCPLCLKILHIYVISDRFLVSLMFQIPVKGLQIPVTGRVLVVVEKHWSRLWIENNHTLNYLRIFHWAFNMSGIFFTLNLHKIVLDLFFFDFIWTLDVWRSFNWSYFLLGVYSKCPVQVVAKIDVWRWFICLQQTTQNVFTFKG